ncbi:MAG TPA: GNAT family N-acetyltransferase [Allosphingosinicella sp.]|jgi:hypothetical protein
MDVSYQLVGYSDEIRDAYLKLLPEQEQAIGRGKLEWKLRDGPGGTGAVAVATAGGEIIGVNAFMPSRFRIGERTGRAYQSMDTIVTPAARGKGVFGRLINCFYDEGEADLLYGFPNANSSPGFFGKLGWAHFGSVPMLFRPLRSGYFLKRVSRFLPDLPIPMLARGAENFERALGFDERATGAWRRFSSDIGCAVERDAAFLNWRLRDNPSERYDILQAEDGSFVAHALSDKHGGRIGYVMEAIGGPATLPGLIAAALRELQASRADAALAWCLPGSPNYAAYRKAGFYPLPEPLRPIVINFGARALAAPAAAVENVRGWYISYLDSDTV